MCNNLSMLTLFPLCHVHSDLICGYITGVHFCLWTKEMLHNVSHEICHNPSELHEYQLCHLQYVNNLTIIYAANNSQLTLLSHTHNFVDKRSFKKPGACGQCTSGLNPTK